MQPITFELSKIIPRSPVEICAALADVTIWPQFGGYAVLPGIASAAYEHRTDDMTGSRIRVRNTDGSEHVEEIIVWQAGGPVVMKLHDFTPPLSRLATHFLEEWLFTVQEEGTLVRRKFQMFPVNRLARPVLWLISLLFRRAIAHHLQQMAAA